MDPVAPPVGPKRYVPARLPEGTAPVAIAELVQGTRFELEIGGGRGGFAFERLAAAPEVALIGFEIKKKWASLTDERLAAQGLRPRARVFGEDALQAMPRLTPDGVFAAAFLHFPDPWWKKRHTKRLVMGDPFLRQVWRLLRVGGELFIQTDVEERAEQYRDFVSAFREGERAFAPMGEVAGDPTLADNPYQARSPREHRAIADGLPVWRMRWQKPE